jgi:hypothetical protein
MSLRAFLPIAMVVLLASSAFAGLDVLVNYDLSRVVMVVGDSTIADMPMSNGVASLVGNLYSAVVGKGDFCGFVTRERLEEVITQSGVQFLLQKSCGEIGLINTAGIYAVTITRRRKKAIPVSFSILSTGVQIHGYNGIWNIGTIKFSDQWIDWGPQK